MFVPGTVMVIKFSKINKILKGKVIEMVLIFKKIKYFPDKASVYLIENNHLFAVDHENDNQQI